MNTAAINIYMYVDKHKFSFLLSSFRSDITSWETAKLFLEVAAPYLKSH